MRLSDLVAHWPRSRLDAGQQVVIRMPQRLLDGRVVPVGQPARVARSMRKGDRTVVIDVVGFGGTAEEAVIGPVGRIEVPRVAVRSTWLGFPWSRPSDWP